MSPRTGAAGIAALLAAAGLLAGAPASAAPLHSPNTFAAVCDAPYGAIQVVGTPGNGRGRFTPGFVVGTHLLGVPYSVEFFGQPPEVKSGPAPKDPVVCTILAPDGVTPVGTVVVAVHGNP